MFILGKIDIYFPTDVHAIVLVHVFEKNTRIQLLLRVSFVFLK